MYYMLYYWILAAIYFFLQSFLTLETCKNKLQIKIDKFAFEEDFLSHLSQRLTGELIG